MKITDNLIMFEKEGKLALMNAFHSRPLIIDKGIDLVKSALKHPEKIIDESLINILLKYQILTETDEEEPETHQELNLMGKKELSLYLLVTQKCQLRCVYCLGNNPSYISNNQMDTNTLEKTLELAAKSMLPGGTLTNIYFGGEPLLNWKLIKHAVKFSESYLKNNFDIKIKHHITSNFAKSLPVDFIEFVKHHKITLLIDIDGEKTIHNQLRPMASGKPTYDIITRNVKKIKQSGVYFELRATVTSANIDSLNEIVSVHKEFNPAASALPTLTPVDSQGAPISMNLFPSPEKYKHQLIEVINKGIFPLSCLCPANVIAARIMRREFVHYGCGITQGNTAAVDSNGDCYPCIYCVGQNSFQLGNIHSQENPFLQENFEKEFAHKHNEKLHVNNQEKCNECKIRYYCGGGCPIRKLTNKGNTPEAKQADEYFQKISCATAWGALEGSLWYFDKAARKKEN